MQLQYIVCIGIITILVSLPVEIQCCSMNAQDIIFLMARNPNYMNDPCYIQWNQAENAKMQDIWTKRKQFEERMEESRRQSEILRRQLASQRENRQPSFVSTSTSERTPKKGEGFWKVLLIFVSFVIGICLIGVCVAASRDNDDNPPTDTPTNRSQNGNQMSVVTSVTMNHQTFFSSTANDNDNVDTSSSQQEPVTYVPLIPRRQNSLPSYDDAVKMPSAPPRE